MGKAKRQKPMWLEAPFLVGITLTVLILGFAVWSLSVGEVCNNVGWCVSKWEVLKDAPPNEIGDSLAGFAGTLAFVWLIVTVWLQASELREQRDEFEKMADAQEKQVGLLVKQGEIFEKEQKQRAEQAAANELDQRLRLIIDVVNYCSETMCLNFEVVDCGLKERIGVVSIFGMDPTVGELNLLGSEYKKISVEENLLDLSENLEAAAGALKKITSSDFEFTELLEARMHLDDLLIEIEETLELADLLGRADATRLRRTRLHVTRRSLKELSEMPVWKEAKKT